MKKLLFTPLLFVSIMLSAQPEIEGVERMPRFPGCENISSEKAKKACADKAMLEFVYKNLHYPKDAAREGIEGTAVVRFVIDINGRLSDIRVTRSVHPSIDEEALRIVKLMNKMEDPWVYGMQKGERVKVQLNLPIKFRL